MAVIERISNRRIVRRRLIPAEQIARVASTLDRAADALLGLGQVTRAELLSRRAEALRAGEARE